MDASDRQSLLLTGIGELVTNDPSRDGLLGVVRDAALVVEGGTVAWVGPPREAPPTDAAYDVGGRAVVPGFVDSPRAPGVRRATGPRSSPPG